MSNPWACEWFISNLHTLFRQSELISTERTSSLELTLGDKHGLNMCVFVIHHQLQFHSTTRTAYSLLYLIQKVRGKVHYNRIMSANRLIRTKILQHNTTISIQKITDTMEYPFKQNVPETNQVEIFLNCAPVSMQGDTGEHEKRWIGFGEKWF